MKKIILSTLIPLCIAGCSSSSEKKSVQPLESEQTSVFTSSDKNLENAYNWAKKMALSYAHDGNDPAELFH